MTAFCAETALGQALEAHLSGRLAEAEAVYRRLTAVSPADPRPWHYLGVLLGQSHREQEGAEAIARSLEIDPNDPEALNNLANIVRSQGRYAESAALCRRAIQLAPRMAPAYVNLSAACRMLLEIEEAISAGLTAVRLCPELAQGHCNLGHAYLFAGRAEEAIAAMRTALAVGPGREDIHQNLLFALQYSDRISGAEIAAETRRYGSRFPRPPRTVPDRPLRTIGFLSGDFRRHPVGLVVTPLLERLAAHGLRTVAFSQGFEQDHWTDRCRIAADAFHVVRGQSAGAVAALVQREGIDLLIDLSGHSADNRMDVMALGPAPLQATWLGYSGSTGVPTIDVVFGDRTVTPRESEGDFTERVARLPDAFLATDPSYIEGWPSPPPATRYGAFTFGSFNNLVKVSDRCLLAWLAVLRAVPEARLLVKGQHFVDPSVRSHFEGRLLRLGADLDRIELRPGEPLDRHWASFGEVDAMLDTFPYTGATTTLESLAMGVPVVTLSGDRYVGRMSESLLRVVGRPDWVARSEDEYVAIATRLASDLGALSEIRADLPARVLASPLCDLDRFAAGFASLCRSVWDEARHRAQAAA